MSYRMSRREKFVRGVIAGLAVGCACGAILFTACCRSTTPAPVAAMGTSLTRVRGVPEPAATPEPEPVPSPATHPRPSNRTNFQEN